MHPTPHTCPIASITIGPRVGRIYVFRGAETGRVKIGFTRRHSRLRLGELQTGCHERLELVILQPGDRADEAAIHQRARRFAIGGEWFEQNALKCVGRHFEERAEPPPPGQIASRMATRVGCIPATISIPIDDGDYLKRSIDRARIRELRSAIRAPQMQVAVDRLMELLDFRLSQGAADDDLVIPDNKPDRRAA